MKRNLDFTKLFRKEHLNKWVALNPAQDFVVASGNSPRKVFKESQKKGVSNPVLTFVIEDYANFIT